MLIVLLAGVVISCESSKNPNYDKTKQTYLEIHTSKDTVINTRKVNISAILVNPQYKEDDYSYWWTVLNLKMPNSANITFDPARRAGNYEVTCRAYRNGTYIAGNLNLVIIDDPDPIAVKEREERKRAEEKIRGLPAILESNFYSYDKFIPLIKDFSFNDLSELHFSQNNVFKKVSIEEIKSTSHNLPLSKSKIKKLFHPLTGYKYYKYPYDEFRRHDLQEEHQSIISGKDYFIKGQKYYLEFPLKNRSLKDFNFEENYYELQFWAFSSIKPGILLENIDIKRRDILLMNPTSEPIELTPDFGRIPTFRIYFINAKEAQQFKSYSKIIRVNFVIKENPEFNFLRQNYEAKLVSVELHTKSSGQYLWRNNKWYLAFAEQGLGNSPERNSQIYELF